MERILIHNASRRSSPGGFTLVEVLIAMLVGTMVMAAVMTSFQSQHATYIAQDEVVEMQQNARVAMDMLVRDIRSAGYDPNNLGAGITAAGVNNLVFTREDDAGPVGLETISYSLFDAYDTINRNDNREDDLALQITDVGGGSAGRQAIAENISRLEFRYLDENGNVTAILGDIRSIQVSIMVLAGQADTQTTPPARTYTTPSGAVWNSTPGFRSVYLTTTVQCRNLGL